MHCFLQYVCRRFFASLCGVDSQQINTQAVSLGREQEDKYIHYHVPSDRWAQAYSV